MTIQSEARNSAAKAALPKVSVVHDDPDQLQFFRGLSDAGHFALLGAYGSGREALTHRPLCRPDVVFMDVWLPDLTGFECTRRLTTILPKLRVIVITGHPEPSVLLQALRAGAAGFVIKPCTVDETLAGTPGPASGARVLVTSRIGP